MNSERCNLVVLRGTVAGDPLRRELSTGVVVVQFDVTTPLPGGSTRRGVAVPVSWPDPPAAADELAAGQEVVVVGSIQRRYFRVGGATQSRTEAVAERVVPSRRTKTARRVVDAAVAALAP